MCGFFSLVSDGEGKIMYFDAVIRKKILTGELKYELDSHTSIADYYGYTGLKEDKLNKYEYNPWTKQLQVDSIGADVDDKATVQDFCDKLDFKTIVPELIIKPIINPFTDRNITEVSKEDIELLKKWVSVRNSAWDSVRAFVWDSVGYSVWDFVRYFVGAYISSFFDVKYSYDFSSGVTLWEKGLVPSYDGRKWRLHGAKGKVIWEGEIN